MACRRRGLCCLGYMAYSGPEEEKTRSVFRVEVTVVKRTRAQALIAALVLALTAGASPSLIRPLSPFRMERGAAEAG